jgi:hypothetical protein
LVVDESVRSAANDLDGKLVGVEEELFQMKVTGRGQDQLRWPAQLVQKLTYLAGEVSLADFAPTKEQAEVEQQLRDRVSGVRSRLDELVTKDVAAFNEMLRQKNVANLTVR